MIQFDPTGSANGGRDEPIDRETVVGLSAYGRATYERIIRELSAEVGRAVSGDEVSRAMRQLQEDLQTEAPDYRDPSVMKRFIDHLRTPPGE